MGLLNDSDNQKKISAIFMRHSQKLIALSFQCGIIWFAILASDVFNNKTYFSENALLPGLVVREFNPRSSLSRLLEALKEEASVHPSQIPSAWIQGHFRQLGLDVYQNNFTVQYPFGSRPIYKGNNLYAILRAPKVASTEAIVITTPYRDYDSIHDNTLPSIALMIELAQTFRKHAYWSKDIIFLVTEHENIGFQAWLDAYHDVSTSDYILSEKLQSTSGLIQGVINLELSDYYFSHIDIKIEGLHGQLPNLDLFNLAVELCIREEIPTSFQSQFNFFPSKVLTWKSWLHNYITMSRMILLQATGLPSGGHGLFHRFGIQALTLKSVTEKRSKGDSVTLIQMGRVLEGTVRSLNNLLEKFHQSFFFYLLPSTRSYVSIGLYIPPFALIALPVLIKALYLYLNIQESESNSEICPRGKIGAKGGILKPEVTVKYGAIFLIFFISGLSLQSKELVAATYLLRVHLFIQIFSLLFIPIFVQIFVQLLEQFYPNSNLLIGFITVSCMPPPVSSAVLLTKKVGGNEAVAVFNSALGSLLGLLVTPALLYLFFNGSGDVPIWSAILQLSLTVVFPVVVGQGSRMIIGYILPKYKFFLSVTGNFLLLLIIYTTFCDTFSSHNEAFTLSTVIITTITVILLQFILLGLAFYVSTSFLFRFTPEDIIAVLYCSTHKSLTLGFPMLKVLYANQAQFILISFPLLVYHPMQILIGSFLVPFLQKWMQNKTRFNNKLHFV
ncbi:glycosylphosphatidylinositol anchor attachment 1 protein [Nephila pilipes]|uniref:Glycosylphosphatidylinositol anchor attachment 1 protein n=1 Tax=Nephila pilipes TaxID=299642 RepID=A0A8X6JH08_NEPPI|nr:glycosylphosphatidylinositol anchor attachment 1 protein [Nephila pilipes]